MRLVQHDQVPLARQQHLGQGLTPGRLIVDNDDHRLAVHVGPAQALCPPLDGLPAVEQHHIPLARRVLDDLVVPDLHHGFGTDDQYPPVAEGHGRVQGDLRLAGAHHAVQERPVHRHGVVGRPHLVGPGVRLVDVVGAVGLRAVLDDVGVRPRLGLRQKVAQRWLGLRPHADYPGGYGRRGRVPPAGVHWAPKGTGDGCRLEAILIVRIEPDVSITHLGAGT